MALPSNIVPENCVLFLGSGFSAGGINLRGTNLPVGRGLEDAIADLLKKDRGRYDLKVLGNAAHRNREIDFFTFLYNLFTVSHLDLYQKKILSKKWQRIYTTNYDDAAEFGSFERNAKDFNYQDPKPKQIPLGSIIHLHGSIKRATQDNILDQLVLNKNSYITQHIVRSPWYDELLRDIRFCDYVFFVGYSLSDPHVLALLNQSDVIKSRSYIIVRSLPDELELQDMEQYGEVLAISVSGFSQALESSIVEQQLPQFENLKSLRYANPFKDDKSVMPATPLEVRRVVMFGDILRHRCLQILPKIQYIIPRLDRVNQSLDLLSVCQTLIVHSRLGNGKSVFAHSLAFYLIERGYHYFWIDNIAPNINKELKAIALSSIEKIAIYFDDYDVAIDIMPLIHQFLPKAKYIVSARTGVQEARAAEAESKFVHPLRRQDINGLAAEDKEGLITLLSTAGISQKGMANAIRNCSDMSEIVTSVFGNEHVAMQIRQEFNHLFSRGDARIVTILATILAYINQTAEAAFYNAVTGTDAYSELIKAAEISRDFFYLENSQIQFRSSLLANYVLSDIFTAEEICRVLHAIALSAVERKRERRYRAILGGVMQFANIKRIVGDKPGGKFQIRNLFKMMQRDVLIQEEPLFWLQYAMIMIEDQIWDLAENFMQSAYDKAHNTSNFETYQIDTQWLRLMMMLEARSTLSTVERLADIEEYLRVVGNMLYLSGHRSFVIRVLAETVPFLEACAVKLSGQELDRILTRIRQIVNIIGEFTPQIKAETGSRALEQALSSAISKYIDRRQT